MTEPALAPATAAAAAPALVPPPGRAAEGRRLVKRFYLSMLVVPAVDALFGLIFRLIMGHFDTNSAANGLFVGLAVVVNLAGARLLFLPVERYLLGRGDLRTARRRLDRLPALCAVWALLLVGVQTLIRLGLLPVGEISFGMMRMRDTAEALWLTAVYGGYFTFLVWLVIRDYAGLLRAKALKTYHLKQERVHGRFVRLLVMVLIFTSALPFAMAVYAVHFNQGEDLMRAVVTNTAAGVVAVVIAVLAVAGGLTRPIRSLLAAVQAAKQGHFDQRVPVETRDEIGALTYAFNDMLAGLREREQLREVFGRHVGGASPAALADAGALAPGRRLATILVADLEAFRRNTEGLSPEVLFAVLDDFVALSVETVNAYGGLVVSIVADNLLATFNLPTEQIDHPQQGLRCAQALRRKIAAHRFPGELTLAVRIGLHAGHVTAGAVGGPDRRGFAAVGPEVTLAVRLEQLNKTFRTGILLSRDLADRLPAGLWTLQPCGELVIEGRDRPVEVLTPIGEAEDAAEPAASRAAG